MGIVDVAMAEEGTIENPRGSNSIKYNDWYYGRHVSGDSYPWCAVFVSWCANQAGVGESTIPKTASVSTLISFFKQNNLFQAKGNGYNPKPGDIMLLSEHSGIVYKAEGNKFYTIEGNYSDAVTRTSRTLNDSSLVGFGTPNYSSNPSSQDYPTSGTTTGGNSVTATQGNSLGVGVVTYKDYIVQSGETLEQIAERNNTTVAMLMFINNLSSPNITPGTSIKIPVNPNAQSLEEAQSGTQPMTKQKTYSVTVSHPVIKVEFYTEYGAISAISSSNRIESNTTLDNDIISVNTKRSLGQDCPTFSVNLVWRNDWFTKISSNDLIIIKMQRPPELERIVMFGLVDDIRRSIDFSSGTPQRVIQISGRGFNKAFMNFEIGTLENLSFNRGVGFMANLTSLQSVNSAIAYQIILNSYVGKAIKYNFGNGQAFESYFQSKLSCHDGEMLIDINSYMTYTGSLWNFLKELSNSPFNETYWEVEDNKPTLIHRATPFNKKEWNELPRVIITDDEIVNDGIGRSDLETYTLYSVQTKISDTLNTSNLYWPLWYKPYYAKHGITQLKIMTPYQLISSVSDKRKQSPEQVRQFFIDLFNWNIKNNVFHNGNLVVKGKANYKIGERLILESENREFYIESVTQSFNVFQSWTTILGVTRGIEPENRFTSPWNNYEEFTPSVATALFNQTGGSDINWEKLPSTNTSSQAGIVIEDNSGGYGSTKVGKSGAMIGSPTQNELIIAKFLASYGFNNAAVSAILANLNHEGNFNPGSVNQGDGADGSDSIGIVQWNSGRAQKLQAFCQENNYDVWSLTGQLNFLIHELKNEYLWVYEYLMNLDNNSDGAKLGALKWASDYEVCAEELRPIRGEDAKNIWYPRYSGR